MTGSDPSGTDWSPSEIDLIIADYFNMLSLDLAGAPYTKAHHNEAMQRLIGRSRGSIEFKHQNTSAVLLKLGLPWILGYKPMTNYQKALIDGIERHLIAKGDMSIPSSPQDSLQFAEDVQLEFEPPPLLTTPSPDENGALQRLVQKFDPAGRDARNRKLGKMGEERILILEKTRLFQQGHDELAKRVRWVSEDEGDGAGFDILSFEPSGKERLIEVKTTIGSQITPFYLSENERALSTERPESFKLVRLYDFARKPKVFQLTPPLEDSVLLRPINYRATFG